MKVNGTTLNGESVVNVNDNPVIDGFISLDDHRHNSKDKCYTYLCMIKEYRCTIAWHGALNHHEILV